MIKQVDADFFDEDHVWINGIQFISLNRFAQMKTEQLKEMKLLQDHAFKLARENENLKQTISILVK